MDFWIALFGGLLSVAIVPYIRCLIKRVILAMCLKKKCHKMGFALWPTHRLWWLGGRQNSSCDFFVETNSHILSIKIFGVPDRRMILVFTDDGRYLFRRIWAIQHKPYPIDSRQYYLPTYDFYHKYNPAWDIKTPVNILLVNPVSHEIRRRRDNGKESIVGAGESVYGMVIYPLSRLLGYLEEDYL